MRGRNFKAILLGCVALHLTLVTLGASYIEIADWIPVKKIIEFYGKASGANSSYGFFAPYIGGKVRAVFDIVDKDGATMANIPLMPGSDREVEIRLGGIFEEFTTKEAGEASYRQPLAASLAAAIFSRHSDASEVVLHVQEFWPKTMEEYRQGKRADWSDYYAARFARAQEHDGDGQ